MFIFFAEIQSCNQTQIQTINGAETSFSTAFDWVLKKWWERKRDVEDIVLWIRKAKFGEKGMKFILWMLMKQKLETPSFAKSRKMTTNRFSFWLSDCIRDKDIYNFANSFFSFLFLHFDNFWKQFFFHSLPNCLATFVQTKCRPVANNRSIYCFVRMRMRQSQLSCLIFYNEVDNGWWRRLSLNRGVKLATKVNILYCFPATAVCNEKHSFINALLTKSVHF